MNRDIVLNTTEDGTTVSTGVSGARGPGGVGVPAGGATGDVLAKATGTDHDTEWISGVVLSSTITSIQTISQVAYDALSPPEPEILYLVTS